MPFARTLRVGLVASGLLVLAATLPPATALARDPLAPAFKKAAKAELRDLAATVGAAVAQAKADLRTGAGRYANGTLDVAAAVAGAVTSITTQRDAIEDAAAEAAARLSTDGAARLTNGGVTNPGADFQAGGRGIWDDALHGIESVLDRADVQLDVAFGKFVADMKRAASKAGATVDLRYRVPPHGEGFWGVAPPFAAPAKLALGPKAGGLDVQPPQILIAMRFVETSRSDQLDLGIRGFSGAVDVTASSSAGESVLLGSPTLDGGGTAVAAFPLEGLLANDSFLNVQVAIDALAGADSQITLSQPRIAAVTGGNLGPIVKEFTKRANDEFRFFTSVTGKVIAGLGKSLASHIKAVKERRATPDQAIAAGFANLRDARGLIFSADEATTSAPVTQAATALAAMGGIDDSEIPSTILPDGSSYFAAMTRKWDARLAVRQAAATAKYDTFIDKVEGIAKSQRFVLAVNAVLGRDRPLGTPMVTLSLTPAVEELTAPHLTDAMLVLTNSGSPALRADLIVKSDQSVVSTPQLSYLNAVDGTIVIGGLVTGQGGVAQTTVPALTDLPLLRYVFRAGRTQEKQDSLLVFVTPRIVTEP